MLSVRTVKLLKFYPCYALCRRIFWFAPHQGIISIDTLLFVDIKLIIKYLSALSDAFDRRGTWSIQKITRDGGDDKRSGGGYVRYHRPPVLLSNVGNIK